MGEVSALFGHVADALKCNKPMKMAEFGFSQSVHLSDFIFNKKLQGLL